MANFKQENVKRFIENISKEVADNAYNGGGSGNQCNVIIHFSGDATGELTTVIKDETITLTASENRVPTPLGYKNEFLVNLPLNTEIEFKYDSVYEFLGTFNNNEISSTLIGPGLFSFKLTFTQIPNVIYINDSATE